MNHSKPSSPASPLSHAVPEAAGGEEPHWVTVTSCETPAEAHLVHGRLEAARIPARLTDEHTVSLMAQLATAVGGVGVQVPRRFAEDALATLRQGLRRDGQTVFRVRMTRTFSTFALCTLSGSLVSAGALILAPALWRWWPWFLVACALGGILAGRQRVYFLCSELRCGAGLDPSVQTCPKCGGHVAGVIHSLDERLEAEEKLRAARR